LLSQSQAWRRGSCKPASKVGANQNDCLCMQQAQGLHSGWGTAGSTQGESARLMDFWEMLSHSWLRLL